MDLVVCVIGKTSFPFLIFLKFSGHSDFLDEAFLSGSYLSKRASFRNDNQMHCLIEVVETS